MRVEELHWLSHNKVELVEAVWLLNLLEVDGNLMKECCNYDVIEKEKKQRLKSKI